MNLWEFYVIFSIGLLSSLHCVQMCGPLVLTYSLPLGTKKYSQQILAHLAYNFGRILTYTLLGAIAGFAGSTVGLIGKLAGFENIAAIVAGVFMIFAGLIMLDLVPGKRLQKFNPLQYTTRFLKPLGTRLSDASVKSKLTLGLMLGFMPCGLVYAALFKAMATGTMIAGALTMTAFGLGTVSALMVIGLFSSAFNFKLGRWGNRLAAISVALLGAFLVWRGVMPMVFMASAANSDSTTPPCHQH